MAESSTAATLVRLFPPAWRARYGEEFIATAGEEPLGARQIFDIVMVAIDAWLSPDVRNATRADRVAAPTSGGGPSMLKSMLACSRTSSNMTVRDGFVGGGVLILSTALFSGVGILARRNGWPVVGEIMKSLAFTGPLMLSMPFWLMKGQPWKAQAAIIGVTLSILVASAWIATRL
ncbi:MAG TPA: hypothetical protein VJV75_02260 [Candidatus Polarisedimenticolia bacterium]|nr:hypothetical protein [Candidatus Polarisedimenticolia bacterium]